MSSKDWKKKNYDRSIKVPESVVAQLRKGTKASNIAKANQAGASPQFKEAVRRFYGKNTVKNTPSSSSASTASKSRVKDTYKPASGMNANRKKSTGSRGGNADNSRLAGTNIGNQVSSKAQAPKNYKTMSAGQTALLASNFIPGTGAAAGMAAKGLAKIAGRVAMGQRAAKIAARAHGGRTAATTAKTVKELGAARKPLELPAGPSRVVSTATKTKKATPVRGAKPTAAKKAVVKPTKTVAPKPVKKAPAVKPASMKPTPAKKAVPTRGSTAKKATPINPSKKTMGDISAAVATPAKKVAPIKKATPVKKAQPAKSTTSAPAGKTSARPRVVPGTATRYPAQRAFALALKGQANGTVSSAELSRLAKAAREEQAAMKARRAAQ